MDTCLKVLIVEDEVLVADDIQASLWDLGYQNTKAVYKSGQVRQALDKFQPDIVLMDINLGKGTDGIEWADYIARHFNLPVIFLTAYSDDAKLNRALEVRPYGYVTKPYSEEDLKINLNLAYKKFYDEVHDISTNSDDSENVIFIKQGSKYQRCEIGDIDFVEADGSYIKVFIEGEALTMAVNLNRFQQKLNDNRFLKVHRSYFVNLDKVDSLDADNVFIKSYRIPVSRSLKNKVFQRVKMV